MPKIINLFSTPLYVVEPDDNIMCITDEIESSLNTMDKNLEYETLSDGLYLWRYYPKEENNLLKKFELTNLKKRILNSCTDYLSKLSFHSMISIERMWMLAIEPLKNFNHEKKIKYVQMENYWHSHSHGHFTDIAGVYYHSVVEDLDSLVFMNPNKSVQERSFPYNNFGVDNLYYSIKPRNGLMLMFPGWLTHRVSQNLTNSDRISLSFDIKIHHSNK